VSHLVRPLRAPRSAGRDRSRRARRPGAGDGRPHGRERPPRHAPHPHRRGAGRHLQGRPHAPHGAGLRLPRALADARGGGDAGHGGLWRRPHPHPHRRRLQHPLAPLPRRGRARVRVPLDGQGRHAGPSRRLQEHAGGPRGAGPGERRPARRAARRLRAADGGRRAAREPPPGGHPRRRASRRLPRRVRGDAGHHRGAAGRGERPHLRRGGGGGEHGGHAQGARHRP
ncbi:MAG: hypothetical protein AVDCRST_MAG89-2545, partial [uncultured Gemmatimonadetes bacterium]